MPAERGGPEELGLLAGIERLGRLGEPAWGGSEELGFPALLGVQAELAVKERLGLLAVIGRSAGSEGAAHFGVQAGLCF